MRVGVFTAAWFVVFTCLGQVPPDRMDELVSLAKQGFLDSSIYKIQFIAVGTNVRLEVLDYGGSGRSVVLLAGQGDTAHVFDSFAPKLAAACHVYGVTRRGVGNSSAADTGYEGDQLGDDVIAILDSLKLNRPVLVGHSFAGVELSSIGTRHPEKIAGLIYLDAGFSYAYRNPTRGDFFDDPRFHVDLAELRKKLSQLVEGQEEQNPLFLQALLKVDLPEFEKDLQERLNEFDSGHLHATTTPAPPPVPLDQWSRVSAMMAGMQKYTEIRVPVLAIFAVPHDEGSFPGDQAFTEAQATAFEKGVPSARVVRLPHASHAIWHSNETDVLREIHTFVSNLP